MADEDERLLLLSVRPRFAEAILTGGKTAELRRTVPSAPVGTRVVLYASSPRRAIVGTARIAGVDTGRPDAMWPRVNSHAALARSEFDAYFEGARQATVLWLTEVVRFGEDVSLAHLRRETEFRPPQSFCYIDVRTLRRLLQGHPGANDFSAVESRPQQAEQLTVVGAQALDTLHAPSGVVRRVARRTGSAGHAVWASLRAAGTRRAG